MTSRRTLLSALLLVISTLGHTQEESAVTTPDRTWNFNVYLDDKPIGSHSFARYGKGSNYEMRIKADFQVKFLFFIAYSYEHRNQEKWQEGCLQAIASETDDNGDIYTVKGRREAEALRVVVNEETLEHPACTTSFSYWDPGFLSQTALLNSQTGEYIPVEITGPFSDTRSDRGTTIQAQRYRIKSKDIDIKLWYSQERDWLALESAVEGGRTLRYERI